MEKQERLFSERIELSQDSNEKLGFNKWLNSVKPAIHALRSHQQLLALIMETGRAKYKDEEDELNKVVKENTKGIMGLGDACLIEFGLDYVELRHGTSFDPQKKSYKGMLVNGSSFKIGTSIAILDQGFSHTAFEQVDDKTKVLYAYSIWCGSPYQNLAFVNDREEGYLVDSIFKVT